MAYNANAHKGPKVSFIGEQQVELPNIMFTKYAMKWISAIVEKHSEEVGFYGVVERDGMNFTITDIFYPKHLLVTAATCEIDPEGMQKIMMYLLDNQREDDIPKLKMWGHSHVNMGVSPSGQDETQAMELVNDNQDYLIRLIANKKGELGITVFDLERNMKISDLGYSVIKEDNEDQEQLDLVRSCFDHQEDPAVILEMIRVASAVPTLRDEEYTAIMDKVVEMKKVNLPAKTPYSYAGRNTGTWNSQTRQWDQAETTTKAKTTAAQTTSKTTTAQNVAKTNTGVSRSTSVESGNTISEEDFPELELQTDPEFTRTSHHSLDDYYNDLYGDMIP